MLYADPELMNIRLGKRSMLKIGDFSKPTRISIRMLRYYDETNLLRPVKIDPDTEHVKFRSLTPLTVASATYQGGYNLIGEVYASVYARIKANSYTPCGPLMNIHHVSPHETQNPEEFVTEICCPIETA